MLKFVVILLVCQAVRASTHASWDALKEKCEDDISYYGISLDDLDFQTYQDNFDTVQQINAEVSWTAGVNCFTLLTKAQRGRYTLFTMPVVEGSVSLGATEETVADYAMPDEYNHDDLKQMTQARNQGGCGSCWAFSALSQLENAYIVKTGEWPTNVDFSEQQLVDCTYEDSSDYWAGWDGCDGGWMDMAWQRIHDYEDDKLCSEEAYEYVASDETCAANMDTKPNAFKKLRFSEDPNFSTGKIFRRYSDLTIDDKTGPDGVAYQVIAESTADFIWRNYSVAIALWADEKFQYYSGGVFDSQTDNPEINHAVTLYGYTQTYFNLQNSWGNWGEDGCMRITRQAGNIINMFNYMMYPKVVCAFGENEAGHCRDEDAEGCMCYNGGLCKDDGTCHCKFGWTGDDCTTEDDGDCECQNNGTCLYTGKCDCQDGWIGEKCEAEDTCGCVNGECLVSGECDCQTGWVGEKCDEEDDEGTCGCYNGGYCNNFGGCNCEETVYNGDKCEFCGCKNGGTCTDSETCECADGYSGDICENEDSCECLNGGYCTTDGGCNCEDTVYNGDKCEFCGCKNGGTCTDSGTCECLDGYSGDICENEDEQTCPEGCEHRGGFCEDDGSCNCTQTWFTGDTCSEEPACTRSCKGQKECYWRNRNVMKCGCPWGTYGRGCRGEVDCTRDDHKRCTRLARKNPEKFYFKCKRAAFINKCPHSCGYCDA